MSKEQDLFKVRMQMEKVGIFADMIKTDVDILRQELERYLKQDIADESYTVRGEERYDL